MLYKNLNFFVYKVRLYCLLYMKIVANTNENHNFCVFELRNKMRVIQFILAIFLFHNYCWNSAIIYIVSVHCLGKLQKP